MNHNLEQQLYNTHPELFLRNTKFPVSIDVGDGWFNIIDQLAYCICSSVNSAKAELFSAKQREPNNTTCIAAKQSNVDDAIAALPSVMQVKEKFGSLRFYYNCNCETSRIDTFIEFAERMSLCTCDRCGVQGKLQRAGWMQVKCDNCLTKK